MSASPLLLRIVLLLALALLGAAYAQSPSPQARDAGPAAHPSTAAPAFDSSDLEETKQDLKQMRVILNQMAANLAFVSDSQSPLKHQFQLEIEMWQVVMMRMQRRIDRMEGKQPGASAPSR